MYDYCGFEQNRSGPTKHCHKRAHGLHFIGTWYNHVCNSIQYNAQLSFVVYDTSEHGIPITPVFVFNEDQLYSVSKVCSETILRIPRFQTPNSCFKQLFLRARLWIVKYFKVALPFIFGRFFLLPFSFPLHVVIGIVVECIYL